MFKLFKNFPEQMKKFFIMMSLIASAGMMKTPRLCADAQKPKIFPIEYHLLEGRIRPNSGSILKGRSLKGFYNLNRALNRLSTASTPGRLSLSGLCSSPKVVGWFRTQKWRDSKAFVGHFADMAQPFLTAILRDKLLHIFSTPDFRYEALQQKITTEVFQADHCFYDDAAHHSSGLKNIENVPLLGEQALAPHGINAGLLSKLKCSTHNASTCETLSRYIKIFQFVLNVNEGIMECGGAQYGDGDPRFFYLAARMTFTEAWHRPALAVEPLYLFCPWLKSIIEREQIWSKLVANVALQPLRSIMESEGGKACAARESFTVRRKKIQRIGRETQVFLCSKIGPIAEKMQASFLGITEQGAFFKNHLQNSLHEMWGGLFERANSSLRSVARALKTAFLVEFLPIFYPQSDLMVQQEALKLRSEGEKSELFSSTADHTAVLASSTGMVIGCTFSEGGCFFNFSDDPSVRYFKGTELEAETEFFYDAAGSDGDLFDEPLESIKSAEPIELVGSAKLIGTAGWLEQIAFARSPSLAGWVINSYLDDLLAQPREEFSEKVFLRDFLL